MVNTVHYTIVVEAAHVELANRLAEAFYGPTGRNTWSCPLSASKDGTPTHWGCNGHFEPEFIELMRDTDRIEKAVMGKVPREDIDAMVKAMTFHQDADPHAVFVEAGLGIPAEGVQAEAAVKMRQELTRPAKYDLSAVPKYDPVAEAVAAEAAEADVKDSA